MLLSIYSRLANLPGGAVDDKTTRTYVSPLRDEQARQTQERILDAVTELLVDHRADEITTRQIADRAGVSAPTVYRHFPDRGALIEAVAARLTEVGRTVGHDSAAARREDLPGIYQSMFRAADAYPVEATADALLNADPRRYGTATRQHTDELIAFVAEELPELDEREVAGLAGLLRSLASVQTWLRMRAEFDVPGVRSGPLVVWAFETLVAEARRGTMPTDG